MTRLARFQRPFTALSIAALTAAALAGATPALAAPQTLTVTSLYAQDKPQTQVWVRFGEILEEKLPGQFTINIITDGALGGEKEEAQGWCWPSARHTPM